jgi:hypothetical protein
LSSTNTTLVNNDTLILWEADREYNIKVRRAREKGCWWNCYPKAEKNQ